MPPPSPARDKIAYRRLTQKDVHLAATRHEMLYAGRMGGARASFAFCDLSGLDLSGRSLSDADFSGAILTEVNFERARLENATFFAADQCVTGNFDIFHDDVGDMRT